MMKLFCERVGIEKKILCRHPETHSMNQATIYWSSVPHHPNCFRDWGAWPPRPASGYAINTILCIRACVRMCVRLCIMCVCCVPTYARTHARTHAQTQPFNIHPKTHMLTHAPIIYIYIYIYIYI